MKRKHLIFMLLALLGITTIFSSCKKDDDDGVNATVNITVKSDGVPLTGIEVLMFDAHTAISAGFNTNVAKKIVATGTDGVATFELDERNLNITDSQTTLYFVTFTTNVSTGKENEDYAVLTIKNGETRSATININAPASYDDNNDTNNPATSTKTTGILTLSNNSGVVYAVALDGETLGYLENGQNLVLDNIKLNVKHEVVIAQYDKVNTLYHQTEVTKYFTFTKAGEKQTYAFPSVGFVTLKHNSSSTYNVYIDGVLTYTLTASGTYSIPFSAGVQHTIEVVQQDGYLFSATQGKKTFTVKEGETITFSGPKSNTSTEYFN